MVMIRNPKFILILFLLSLPVALYADRFKVIRLNDGGTITAVTNGKAIKIRLIGIDAPELSRMKHISGQPFSQKSKEHLANLVLNKSITIKSYGTDRNGRSLCEVFVNGVNINLEMVRVGLAEVYRGKPAKGMDMDIYRDAERDAKDKAIGIWELRDQYFSPMSWREMYGVEE